MATATERLIASVRRFHFSEIAGKIIKLASDDYDNLFLAFEDGYCKVKVKYANYDDSVSLDFHSQATVYELQRAGFISLEEYQVAQQIDLEAQRALVQVQEKDQLDRLIKKLGKDKIRELLS